MVLSPSPLSELSESQQAVLQKYLINGETTWAEVIRRVARFVSSAEATPELQQYWEEKFLSVLLPMKLVPGGSILANCNHGTQGLLNCFVLSAEDNIYSITKLVSDAVLTTKFRGGVGINIGSQGQKGYIRPKGAPFQDGKALGPCAVLDMVSENSKKITTGNKARRGAFLFSMDWRHPDIWEFIQAKTQSTIDAQITKKILEDISQLVVSDAPEAEKRQKLRELNSQLSTAWVETHLSPEGKRDRRWHNANISVQLDDEFFRLLDQGDTFANDLWDKIAQFAHDTADPGLLLIDNAKRRSPIRDFVTCTNPCVTGDTWVLTDEGPRKVKDLEGTFHRTIINGEAYPTTPEGFFLSNKDANGEAQSTEVLLLKTKEGYELNLTGNHKVWAICHSSGPYPEWVEAAKLKPGDKVKLHDHRKASWKDSKTFEDGWLLGVLIVQGEFEEQGVSLTLEEEFSESLRTYAVSVMDKVGPGVEEYAHHNHESHSSTFSFPAACLKFASSFGISQRNREISKKIEEAGFNFYRGFLRGVYDAAGQIKEPADAPPIIQLEHESPEFLKAIQRMLLRLGIVSKISPSAKKHDIGVQDVQDFLDKCTNSKNTLPSIPESDFLTPETQDQYKLLITGQNIDVFSERIGFNHKQKEAQLVRLISYYGSKFLLEEEEFFATISDDGLQPNGFQRVYDCQVPGEHRFDANGIVAHNCGEIFLPPNSACNLGSLVLTKFVIRKPDGSVVIDWDDLTEAVRISIRFLDNVLDVSEFATPDQKHNVRHVFRQLGLGIMGWADYLKLAHIPYDSAEHLSEIDRWGSWIAEQAYRMSEEIAAEKGPCGIWDKIAEVRTGNLFERWQDSEGNTYNGWEVLNSNRQDLKQVPRRNSTVLSIAPTGSIAQLAACSWAFEPDFGLTVWKQVFVDASRNQQNWVQILNPYLEELDLSEADSEIVKRTGSLKNTEFAKQHPEIANSFKIAREIPPGWHILVQSKWQDWIDSSISKTINLPGHASVAEIKQIYRLAEKAGLKGVTVYRSGTLESEPVKVGDEEKNG